ncbi:mitochondrial ribonuclease P protein 1 homolog [Bombus pascuorum]|uniref:mitochondrial ribonuclease P protein 1 homolog n=1 Tax=Bombus pascuorum TaxID=65598 RepID=UPI00298D85CD|nr:mitochondrial ribonuclease P protein 1 homolog [Bombus pascuorum]
MFNRVSSKFITIATKFYSPVFIRPTHKFTVLQPKYPVQTHILIRRTCSTMNRSEMVSEEYRKLYEEELNSLLKDSKYKAMYDKYSLEIEYLKYMTNKVPDNLTAYNWLYLLNTTTKNERRSYMEFLWKVQMKRQSQKQKKLLKLEKKAQSNIEDSVYGLNKFTMFHRIRPNTINRFYNGKLITAMLYEPALVIDVSYDEYMTPHEKSACAKQLSYLFATNRFHISPFNVYFCNINKDSVLMNMVHKIIPSLYDPDFPLNITSKSYLELFDKNKLVYLTPHTNTILEEFDGNSIYIIGAMVDKKTTIPLSYQKAKEQGIKMMRLPLSEKLDWGTGSSKSLPLNHVMSIMLDLKHFKNWDVALENIPKRKLQPRRLLSQRNKLFKQTRMLKCFHRNRTSNLTDEK